MNLLLSVDRAVPLSSPDDDAIRHWVISALHRLHTPASPIPELSIRITDREDAARFNHTYRDKPDATNVLSFPADPPAEAQSGLLGDLVICAPLVQQEATEQHKSEEAHWAHLIIHGVLHLLGHDHQVTADAEQMEALEIAVLDELGFPNPYHLESPPEGKQP